MSQQQMNYDEINRDEHASYNSGYQEAPHYSTYSSPIYGQKIAPKEALKVPSPAQRLALAIVSLLSMVMMMFVGLAIGFVSSRSEIGFTMIPLFLFLFILLFVAIIVINALFNRRR